MHENANLDTDFKDFVSRAETVDIEMVVPQDARVWAVATTLKRTGSDPRARARALTHPAARSLSMARIDRSVTDPGHLVEVLAKGRISVSCTRSSALRPW